MKNSLNERIDIRTIAAVDDEQDILELLEVNLKKAGYSVRTFETGASFSKYMKNETPDLVLLDMMLPDTDGLELLKNIKSGERTKRIPVMMLTARSDETDKIVGLELGADDYITKPFSVKELAARVKAVLRRYEDSDEKNEIKIGRKLKIDLMKREVYSDGEKIDLTTTEFNILSMLAERKGWVFSREKILQKLWGDEKMVIERTVDVHIKKLREKLGRNKDLIRNIRGIGYKIEE